MFHNMFVDNFVFGCTLKGGFLLHLFFLLLDQSRWRTATFDILIGQFSIAQFFCAVAPFAQFLCAIYYRKLHIFLGQFGQSRDLFDRSYKYSDFEISGGLHFSVA